MRVVLLLKAEQLGLFEKPVQVTGHTRRDGTFVKPHVAHRWARRGQADLFHSEEPLAGQVVPMPYVSGMSAPRDFEAALSAKSAGVGVEALELSRRMINRVADAVTDGASVFVDSGAFRAFKASERQGVSKDVDFERIMAVYREISDRVMAHDDAARAAPGLMLVMPDVVGEQEETLLLIEQYKNEIADFIERGHEVVIPFQRGAIRQDDAYRMVRDILHDLPFVVGIPSNAAALHERELWDLLKTEPDRVHILGAISSRRFDARMNAIRHIYKHVMPGVTADANALRARLDAVIGKSKAERAEVVKEIADGVTPAIFRRDKQDREDRRAALVAQFERDGAIHAYAERDPTREVLVTRNMSNDEAPYRVTYFTDGKPTGHSEYGHLTGGGPVNSALAALSGYKVHDKLQ